MRNYLLYQEMKLTALSGVATPTFFVNSGNYGNHGQVGEPGTYQEGILVGLVGPHFKNAGIMDSKYLLGSINSSVLDFPGFRVLETESLGSLRTLSFIVIFVSST